MNLLIYSQNNFGLYFLLPFSGKKKNSGKKGNFPFFQKKQQKLLQILFIFFKLKTFFFFVLCF